jgi:hypothetical protein
VTYVSVEHEPEVWVDAHVEKQWRREGRWWLSVYYFVDGRQYYRAFEAAQVRPPTSVDLQDAEEDDPAAAQEQPKAKHERQQPIDLRHPENTRRPD